jgi:hypothetical protein
MGSGQFPGLCRFVLGSSTVVPIMALTEKFPRINYSEPKAGRNVPLYVAFVKVILDVLLEFSPIRGKPGIITWLNALVALGF